MSAGNRIVVDVAIVGGGIAGLWILERVRSSGRRALLLERRALGDGQTIASQGIVHGGLKYAFSGTLHRANDGLAEMPQRWRRCLEGNGEVDLTTVRVPSQRLYCWSNEHVMGQLGAFLASKLLQGRAQRLSGSDRPAFIPRDFAGAVYALEDLVVDVSSLLHALAAPHAEWIVKQDVRAEQIEATRDGRVEKIVLDGTVLAAEHFVFAAGAGNEALVRALPGGGIAMQRRPLKQVAVSSRTDVPVFGHWITGLDSEPRLTITTHALPHGGAVYYLGGRLAAEIDRSDDAQIAHARAELACCLPWLDFSGSRFRTVTIDRAERAVAGRSRPETPCVEPLANVIVCWPTKLSFAPRVGDEVLAHLGDQREPIGDRQESIDARRNAPLLPGASPGVARAPWEASP